MRFIDSFRFMSTSLDALIKNLDPEQCKNLKKFYSDRRKFDLLKRKGVNNNNNNQYIYKQRQSHALRRFSG